jgi:hypothetical protein
MFFTASYWLPEVSGDAGDMKRQNEMTEVSKSWARLELLGISNAQPTGLMWEWNLFTNVRRGFIAKR